MKKFFLIIPVAIMAVSVKASPKRVESYVAKHKKIAIKEMHRTGVPASITLAQGIIESNCGASRLAKKSNNDFGIKANGSDRYKVYQNLTQSFIDHSEILKHHKQYAYLFKLPQTDYKGWAEGLQKAKYANDQHYAKKIIAVIQHYHLEALDKNKPIAPLFPKQQDFLI